MLFKTGEDKLRGAHHAMPTHERNTRMSVNDINRSSLIARVGLIVTMAVVAAITSDILIAGQQA